jgi:hypothetical protein
MSLGSWIDAAVHDYYVDVQPLHTLIGRASPLMDDLRKSAIEGANTGEFFTLAGGMGIAGDLASAQETASQVGTGGAGTAPGSATLDGQWLVPHGQIETSLRLKYRDLVIGKTNKGAYVRNLTHATDKHGEAFGERFAQLLLGGSGYTLGEVDLTTSASGTVTMVDQENIANIHKGMILVASAANGATSTDTLLPSNVAFQKAYVKSVSRDAGTFVISAVSQDGAAGFPAGWGSQGDNVFIFPLGQFRPLLPGATFNAKLMVQSISQWITPTVATDSFNTVDRSQDSALSGVRPPSAVIGGLPPEHKIGAVAAYMQQIYAATRPLTYVAAPLVWFSLVRSLAAQGLVREVGGMLTGGGKSVQVATVLGDSKLISEPHQDPNFVYGLLMDEIKIHHLDGLPGVANADGFQMLRQADSNDLEFRLICFPQLIIREPWRHVRFAL